MTEVAQFEPNYIWTPESIEEDEAISKARLEMNAIYTPNLIEDLRSKVDKIHGMEFAVLNGDNPLEYSAEEALVIFDTFSVGLSPNRLVKAEFIRRVAKHSGATDDKGKFKPIILLASPGKGSTIELSKTEKDYIKNGYLGHAAEKMLQAVTHRSIGRVGLLGGFSQGASMALEAALRASKYLDITHLAAAEMATVEDRSPLRLGWNFRQAMNMEPSIKATDLNAQKETLNLSDMARFALGAAMPVNWALWQGLSKDSFLAVGEELLAQGKLKKLLIGYSDGSAISKPEKLEPKLQKLKELDDNGILVSVRVNGANHTWGDNLPLLAKFYMLAIS